VWKDPFHPTIFLKVVMLIGYFAGIIKMISQSNSSFSLDTLLAVAVVGLVFVITVDLLALTLLVPSYQHKQMLLSLERPFASREMMRIFMIIYVLGWGWRLYALSKGFLYGTLLGTTLEVTAYGNVLSVLNNLGFVALMGIVACAKSFRLIISIAALEIGFAMICGSKGAILYILLPVFVILFHRKLWQPSFRSIIGATFIALAGLLAFTVVDEYRAASQWIMMRKGTEALSPITAFEVLRSRSEVPEKIDTAKLVDRITILSEHFAYIVDVDRERHLGRWLGESYLPLVVWFIPRAVWPNKPVFSRGYWYAGEILGWQYRTRAEAAITLWGDAYMNFGWIGTIFVPIVWICIVFLVYKFSLAQGIWGLVFIGAVYNKFLMLEQNMAVPLTNIIQTGLVVLLLYGISRFLLRTTCTRRMKRSLKEVSNG